MFLGSGEFAVPILDALAGSPAVVLVGVNVVASNFMTRFDFTSEQLYSQSPATRKGVQDVPASRPVLIQAFISPEVPKEYVQVKSTLIGLLRQLDQLGGDRVRVRIVDTERFTEQADDAKRYGIGSSRSGAGGLSRMTCSWAR